MVSERAPGPVRCLWITRLVPYPPFQGGDAIYSARLIESLAATGVEVTVLCHDQGGGAPPEIPGVRWVVVPMRDRRRILSLASRDPALVFRFSTPNLASALADLLEEQTWDAVVVDNIAVAGTVRRWFADRRASRPATLVHVSHNHEETIRRQLADMTPWRSPTRFALRLDARKSASVERRLVKMSDLVTTNTMVDADLFRERTPDQRYLVLSPGYDRSRVELRTIDRETPRRVVVLGSYGWVAKQLNLWRFLKAAAKPLARAGIGIDVVGWAPDDVVAKFREAFPTVAVSGSVETVSPYLTGARIGIVAEEIGGGFKHKVLDYVFNRVPVAALAGSVAGVPLVPGDSMLEFADMTSLVEGIIEMIDDVSRLDAIQQAAFSACDGQFDWMDRGRALAGTLAAAVSASASARSRTVPDVYRPRVVFIIQAPTPYTTAIMSALNRQVDLHVVYMRRPGRRPDNAWVGFRDPWGTAPEYEHSFHPSLQIHIRRQDFLTHAWIGISVLLTRIRPDVVVIDGWGQFVVEPLIWSRMFRRRVVLWGETHARSGIVRSPFSNQLRRRVFRAVHSVITNGRLATEYAVALGADSSRIVTSCLPSAIAASLEPTPIDESTGARFLFVGRLTASKRPLLALSAFRQILREIPGVTLTFVGDGLEEDRTLAAAASMSGRVRFLGRVEGPELGAIYAEHDVLVAPFVREVWGLVVNEALAAGLFVIASDAVGSAVTLVDQQTGIIVAPDDEEALVNAMRAASDRLDRSQEARSRRAARVADCTPARFADDIVRAIDIAMTRDSSGGPTSASTQKSRA
jgi:glycosyltransferase involved in cell wall biosynthesis